MKRLFLVPILLCMAAAALAQGSLAVRVRVPSGATGNVPVVATAAIPGAQKLLPPMPADHAPFAVEVVEGRERPVFAQIETAPGDQVRVGLLLQAEPAGERLILLRPPTAGVALPVPPALKVTRQGAAITIANGGYEITHDPARQGGLPSRIVFTQTGKVFDTFNLNDRLHSKQIGGYNLAHDKHPQVTLLASGSLYAQIQVEAKYLQGEKAPPGNARATYTYTYFAGSPIVHLSAQIRQDEPRDWNELHFFELHFKNDSFTRWAVGEPGELKPFVEDKSCPLGGQWGLLAEGKSVIGYLGSARVYDGKNDYGRYLHGPWVAWNGTETRFDTNLFIGTADDPVGRISTVAANGGERLLAGSLYTPKLLAAAQKLRTLGAKQPRALWVLSLLQSALDRGALTVPQAEACAVELAARDLNALSTSNALRLGDQTVFLVAAPRLAMAVSQAQDTIVSLYDLKHHRELLAAPALWFRLSLQDAAGVTRTLEPTECDVPRAGGARAWPLVGQKQPAAPFKLDFRPKAPELAGLEVLIRPTLTADRLSWSVAVTNNSDRWSLTELAAPVLRVGLLGDDAGDDRVLVPSGFGKSYPVATRPNYRSRYPSGSAAMQWMAVTDDLSGVYVAAHDPTASTKTVVCDQPRGGQDVPLSFEVQAPDASVPGNDYAVPGEFVIAAVDGGYLPSCLLYRRWLDQKAPWWPEPGKFSRSDYPQWIRDTQAWSLTGGFPKDCVPQTKAFAEAMGAPTALHWYSWHVIPFDNDYPHYFPTKEGFRDGVRELQQAGVRVMPYINGRLWDTDTEDFIADAHKYAGKKPDGTWYTEEYGSKQKLAPMCPATEYWRAKLEEIVLRLVRDEGVDGVYLDQIGAAAPVLCYDKSHGHPLAGGHWWVDGYWQLLDRLQQRIAQVSPDKMLTTESNAESYAKYFDAYLMCNSNGDYEAPLFPAVYGGKILMFGTYMMNSDFDNPELMAQRQGKLFAFGTQLWWSNPSVTRNERATKWLRDLVQLRRQVNEFFVNGQMAAPPALREPVEMVGLPWAMWNRPGTLIHTPAVWATTWRTQDGRLLMPLVNIPQRERTVTIHFSPADHGLKSNAAVKIERMGSDGAVETFTKTGTFDLPVKLGPSEATALRITPQ